MMNTDISLASTGTLTKQEYDESQLFRSSDDELDRSAFLKLLTTQLQNQNPLDPMKNEAFVAQLAQFSQLEGITNMSTSLSDVADVIRSDRIMSGANLVGKSVFGQTGRISTDGQSVSQIVVYLPYGAEQVDLGIYDMNSGALIRSIVSGPQGSGTASFGWDGRMADGTAAPAGDYVIRGTANIDGAATDIYPSTFAKVNTVSWDAQSANLNLNLAGGVTLPISEVSRIGEAPKPSSLTNQTDQAGE
jgi:flagellar basal-body rod modification protein FlgD